MCTARICRVLLVLVSCVAVRSAAAITVTSSTDDGPGSLRQALVDVADGEIIDFALPTPSTIRLTSGELVVAKSVTIVGPGSDALTIDGNASFRVFHVAQGKIVTILRLTATNGKTDDGGGCIVNEGGALTLDHVVVRQCSGYYGGGVLNDGEAAAATMLIADSTIADNATSGASGGGIYNDGSTPTGNATLEVLRSTISGNQATTANSDGGGILNDSFDSGTAILKVHASTFSGNGVTRNGGGISNVGALLGHATADIVNSTFADNVAPNAGGAVYNDASGGGIAGLQIGNTLLAAGASGGTIANGGGAVSSLGFNLASDAAGGDATESPGGLLASAGDRRNTDPVLGPLADNGGATPTHKPGTGSPAIDQGKRDTIPTLADTTDQRGSARPVDDPAVGNSAGGDGSDIGAFEAQAAIDLAVTRLKVPARVMLRAGAPATKAIKVTIQNRTALPVIIPDAATLAALVEVEATAIGAGCAAPVATLVSGKPNVVPVTVKPKKKRTAVFDVTFDCATDPQKTTGKSPGHDDFRWVATVHADALAGKADGHEPDDVCPRPALPNGTDAQPDPNKPIKDKGCGARNPDKSLGADVVTDVVAP